MASSGWLVGLLLFAAAPLVAQVPGVKKPEEPAKAVETAPAVAAIAAAEIPALADRDERYAQDLAARAGRPDSSSVLAAQLKGHEAGIDTLLSAYRSDELRDMPILRLQSLENHWLFYERQLAQWRRELQRLTGRYSSDLEELARRKAVWQETLAVRDALPAALQERIATVLAELRRTDEALSKPLDAALRLGARGNRVQLELDTGRQSVEAAMAEYNRRLSMIDAPALWTAWREPQAAKRGLVSTASIGVRIESNYLRDYFAAEGRRLTALGLIWAVSLPLLLWLIARSRREASPAEAAVPAPVLKRPISAWLLLGLLGIPFALPDAPVSLHQAALLLGLIPVLRLLPPEVFVVLRFWPYAITGLYVLHRSRILLLDHPLYYRLHVLLTSATAAVLIIYLLRSAPQGPLPGISATARVAFRAVGWFAAATMLIAVASNVLGNISLAEMLTSGGLEAGYIGLAIYAGLDALVTFARLLLSSPAAARLGGAARPGSALRNGLHKLLKLGALALWAVVVVGEFQVYRPVADWLTGVLTHPLPFGSLSPTLGGMLMFAIAVWAALWIARTMRLLLQDDLLPHMTLPPGVANSVSSLTYYALVLAGILIALAAAGFQLSQLTLVVGALSLGIGFGLQNVVNNFVSGLILMFERPIRIGDVVDIAGASGRVREIGMRATTLQMVEGAEVVVPNGTLLQGNIVNWTLSNTNRRVDVDVGVAYGSDPAKVLELLAQVARSTPGIAAYPEPTAVFLRFGPSALEFGVRAWTSDFDDWRDTQSVLAVQIYTALKAAQIEVPFPQQDLHLRSVSDEARAALAEALTVPAPKRGPDSGPESRSAGEGGESPTRDERR